ncbi:MAG: hypothetical protein CBC48_14825 [bacterium TMED88]|nr:putative sulfate exporter family transporter [Deltaproteobacteria bacterium]OUV26907.1 MAG: hypothetical protein CBC48_14825 [bacterium TMED88]
MSAGGPLPGDPYANPEISHFMGSMEGIPDFRDIAETPAERAARQSWRASGHTVLDSVGRLLPGLCLALLIAMLGRGFSSTLAAGVFGFSGFPISPILLAILAGLLLRNTLGLPAVYEDGLRLSIKHILRIGVALLGIRLGLVSVGTIGLMALPLIILCIGTAIGVVQLVSRWLSMPARLGTLIAVGTAICGNTAIVATGPVIQANEDEVSYAVGTITLFGLVALVLHPFIAHFFFGGGVLEAGLFLGTAIHDTAQVAGAGLLYSQQYDAPGVLDTATVTKLVRNLFMIAVIPIMALVYQGREGQGQQGTPSLRALVPTFVIGFLAMVGLRTLGDFGEEPFAGLLSVEQWQGFIAFVSTLSTWCLTTAMAAVGLGTHLARLRGLGWRPLGVGLVAAVTVGLVSAVGIAVGSWALGGLA